MCVCHISIFAVSNTYLNICILRAMFGLQIAYHERSLRCPRPQSLPGGSTMFHLTTGQLPIRQIGVGPHKWEREPCTLAGSCHELPLPGYENQLESSCQPETVHMAQRTPRCANSRSFSSNVRVTLPWNPFLSLV